MKRARIALVGVVFAAVAYNLVRFFEYRVDTGSVLNREASAESSAEAEEAAGSVGYLPWLRSERLYFVFYHIGLYLVTHFLGPFVIITVLNFLILMTMKKSRTLRARLMPNTQESPSAASSNGALLRSSIPSAPSSKKRRVKTKTTQMIVVVTAMFLICNTLPFVLNIWEAVMPQVFTSDDQNLQSVAYMLVDLSNTLVVFNSASTFLLYVAYCKKYRDLFMWYCLAPWRLFSNDETALRRHLPLYLANDRSNSLEVSKFLTFVNAGVKDQHNVRRNSLATAAVIPSVVVPFLAIEECSESELNSYSPKSVTPFMQESPRSVTSTMVPSCDTVVTKL